MVFGCVKLVGIMVRLIVGISTCSQFPFRSGCAACGVLGRRLHGSGIECVFVRTGRRMWALSTSCARRRLVCAFRCRLGFPCRHFLCLGADWGCFPGRLLGIMIWVVSWGLFVTWRSLVPLLSLLQRLPSLIGFYGFACLSVKPVMTLPDCTIVRVSYVVWCGESCVFRDWVGGLSFSRKRSRF